MYLVDRVYAEQRRLLFHVRVCMHSAYDSAATSPTAVAIAAATFTPRTAGTARIATRVR